MRATSPRPLHIDNGAYRGNPPRCPAPESPQRARELIVDAPLRDLAVLATIALLFVAVVQVIVLAQQRRKLEARLIRAQDEMDILRRRLADATRPPTQFARMRLRESAIYRFGRLRRAVPRRPRTPAVAENVHDLTH